MFFFNFEIFGLYSACCTNSSEKERGIVKELNGLINLNIFAFSLHLKRLHVFPPLSLSQKQHLDRKCNYSICTYFHVPRFYTKQII